MADDNNEKLSKPLTDAIEKSSKDMSNLFVGMLMSNGHWNQSEWHTMPGPALYDNYIKEAMDSNNTTLPARIFRAQVRTELPGGLTREQVEELIKSPEKDKELIEKISVDPNFRDENLNLFGGKEMYLRAVFMTQNRKTEDAIEKLNKGVSEADILKELAVDSEMFGEKSRAQEVVKTSVERLALLKVDKHGKLEPKQEDKLLKLNEKAYELNKEVYKEDRDAGLTVPTKAEFLYDNGSKKYRSEHSRDKVKDDVSVVAPKHKGISEDILKDALAAVASGQAPLSVPLSASMSKDLALHMHV